jgi:hypothetical protein
MQGLRAIEWKEVWGVGKGQSTNVPPNSNSADQLKSTNGINWQGPVVIEISG